MERQRSSQFLALVFAFLTGSAVIYFASRARVNHESKPAQTAATSNVVSRPGFKSGGGETNLSPDASIHYSVELAKIYGLSNSFVRSGVFSGMDRLSGPLAKDWKSPTWLTQDWSVTKFRAELKFQERELTRPAPTVWRNRDHEL
jgi:hypothetical protein